MATKKNSPVIKITKIFPPTKESVETCRVSAHGDIECWFTVNGVKYVLHYNPKLAGYNGMPAEAYENCEIIREADNKTFNCTSQYAIPGMPYVSAYGESTSSYFGKNKAVDSFMNPTEQMLLDTFINPFVKDYDIASFKPTTEADVFWNGLTATEKEAVVAMVKAVRAIAKQP
jgi:hypothetical protein